MVMQKFSAHNVLTEQLRATHLHFANKMYARGRAIKFKLGMTKYHKYIETKHSWTNVVLTLYTTTIYTYSIHVHFYCKKNEFILS